MDKQTLHIIKACGNGNSESQDQLYHMFKTKWYMTALRYGKDKHQANDIFQEGMIQIFKDINQFDHSKSNFGTWSNRILVHAALKYLKKYVWQDSMKSMDEVMHMSTVEETIYDKLSAKELTRIIQKLPIGYRMVFNMFAIEGYKHDEIAKELSITIGTSKSQLYKARKELKKHLESQLMNSRYE